ncbi:MAG: excinuclease ABC subunit UvrC [Desulforegulaceae bacterium]|nr:excinuclease ABC subunit UvrC [Desulforegulaceae bacterium]
MTFKIREFLAEKTAKSPLKPGVYLMRDENGNILYIGKAKNLRNRLSTYFRRKEKDSFKTSILVSKVQDFEVILTSNEKEAFLLESSLIKKNKPKYNIILKDDKSYPYIKLDLSKEFPKFSIARKIAKDNSKYFGPFSSGSSVRHTLKLIQKVFKIRNCRNSVFNKRERPCLNYQMKLCNGPCVCEVDQKEYMKNIREAILVLKGKAPFLLKKIENEMKKKALAQEFEKAAVLRDKLFALKETIEKQSVAATDLVDRDFVSIAGEELNKVISLFKVRSGFIHDKKNFEFSDAAADPEDILESFIKQYYEKLSYIPKEIIVNLKIPEKIMIESFLRETFNKAVKIIKPERGEKKALLDIVSENAQSAKKELDSKINLKAKLLSDLKYYLGMKNLPLRIECFDNSNISGTNPVSAMVVYENGKPSHDEYRRYNLSFTGKPDDYSYMKEALFKRFDNSEKPNPDLLIVDGGKGQLNIAIEILRELGLNNSFSVIALAEKNEAKGEDNDKVYLPGRMNPLLFHNKRYLLHFLMTIRDAAHNNVINFHRKKRKKQMKTSSLDNIQGLGPKRKKLLLDHFKTFKNLKEADFEEIASVKGIPEKTAKLVFEKFH